MSRIYVVTDTITADAVLVESASQAQAVHTLIKGRYVARAANAMEVAKMMASGKTLFAPVPEVLTVTGTTSDVVTQETAIPEALESAL